jgi:hypothetical protein
MYRFIVIGSIGPARGRSTSVIDTIEIGEMHDVEEHLLVIDPIEIRMHDTLHVERTLNQRQHNIFLLELQN